MSALKLAKLPHVSAALGRLSRVDMPLAGRLEQHLARGGDLEPLAGRLVRLKLGHSFLLAAWATAPRKRPGPDPRVQPGPAPRAPLRLWASALALPRASEAV